jgi:hypothetical protein
MLLKRSQLVSFPGGPSGRSICIALVVSSLDAAIVCSRRVKLLILRLQGRRRTEASLVCMSTMETKRD